MMVAPLSVMTVNDEWEMITHNEDGPHFQLKNVKAEWEKTGHNEDAKISLWPFMTQG